MYFKESLRVSVPPWRRTCQRIKLEMIHPFGTFEFDADSGELRKNRRRRSLVISPRLAIFDNETGMFEHGRLVTGLSDLVVERLTELDSERIAVIGNAHALRQPRAIRNLKALQDTALRLDYVLLGQLQKARPAFTTRHLNPRLTLACPEHPALAITHAGG